MTRRPERLLPFACIAAAACLFASEFMTTFEFTPEGGEPLCSQLAADRHHFALGVLAIFAVLVTIVALVSASKPAAVGVGVAGVIALLIFLITDLPDANNVGTLGDSCTSIPSQSFFDAKAIPQAGFWLEMVGALGLALSGAALATLAPEQLRALRPRWLRLGGEEEPGPAPTVTTTAPANPAGGNDRGAENQAGRTQAGRRRERT